MVHDSCARQYSLCQLHYCRTECYPFHDIALHYFKPSVATTNSFATQRGLLTCIISIHVFASLRHIKSQSSRRCHSLVDWISCRCD